MVRSRRRRRPLFGPLGGPPTDAAGPPGSPIPPGGPSRRTLLSGAAALGLLGITGAAGCARIDPDGGDPLERLRARGVVRLGIASEIPYSYIDEDDGSLTGQSPAIAREIFGRLGIERFQPVLTEFGSLIPGLRARQFDVVAAGMWISPERCEQVIFSDPDYVAKDAFIVAEGNPLGITDYASLAESGATSATGPGWFQRDYAVGNGVDPGSIGTYPDQLAGLNAVRHGRIDAFFGTAPTMTAAVREGSGVEVTEPFVPVVDGEEQLGAGGFAFRPDETALRDAFNTELHDLKATGRLLELVEPYGFTEEDMTDLTAEELCSP
ncbi:ectoine/hydroxyectoine ABC transporter substrate-binding protein EhuB [Streptomyces calidiresistens]|uniref:Ectoine/hydroxyectoine ABC transporter substrate-binding protein EhuB n=1 Tax=Streptomyces calidiresistens TaxID=1485586 RepID=A0A7W3T343_9ACTN|nr:ectoine/hydroxyectoine ABC transporter substrate-binding protein EhuB [Streptomyces calidiresistens]MBB0229706.1 ectoine/hydroxyectoine ABC transporter substrate-binding protein EhuB [Streptomyces calidiresistens]